METILHATCYADKATTPDAARPTLQKCVVPVAPTCFLLHASAGASISELSSYLHEIAKTYHAYGAANLTFIISDMQALQLGGFFLPENQSAMVGELSIELRYLIVSEAGATHVTGQRRKPRNWGEYIAKAGAR